MLGWTSCFGDFATKPSTLTFLSQKQTSTLILMSLGVRFLDSPPFPFIFSKEIPSFCEFSCSLSRIFFFFYSDLFISFLFVRVCTFFPEYLFRFLFLIFVGTCVDFLLIISYFLRGLVWSFHLVLSALL